MSLKDSTKEPLLEELKAENLMTLFHKSEIENNSRQRIEVSLGGVDGLLSRLKVKKTDGLDIDNKEWIEKLKKEYGTNAKIEEVEKTFLDFVKESLQDDMLRILLLASLVSTIIGILKDGWATGWIEGFAIFLAVFVVVAISSFQNWNKEQQFKELKSKSKDISFTVLRKGKDQKISVYDILVGDILTVCIGDIIPVDGLIISGNVKVNEAAVTGEPEVMLRTENFNEWKKGKVHPLLISGAEVNDGTAKMLVLCVGKNSYMGKTNEEIRNAADKQTNLEEKLEKLAAHIGNFGFISAISIGILMIVKEIILRSISGEPVFSKGMLDVVINSFIICVTVIVVAIPEGLPMAVTISLAYSVLKMKDEKNLVRHIDAAETMGNCNNICTDKTGTLTTGIMEVTELFMNQKSSSANEIKRIDSKIKATIGNAISNCLFPGMSIDQDDSTGKDKIGNMTDFGFIKFVRNNYDLSKLEKYKTKYVQTFNSTNKFTCSICSNDGKKWILFVKGAPEVIIEKCNSLVTSDDLSSENLNDDLKRLVNKQKADWEDVGKRGIGIAYKEIDQSEFDLAKGDKSTVDNDEEIFKKLVVNLKFLSLVAISDPVRGDVKAAVEKCQNAGVTIRMVTGDNINTALYIARSVGIILDEQYTKGKIDSGSEMKELVDGIIAYRATDFRRLSGDLKTLTDDEVKSNVEFNEKTADTKLHRNTNKHQLKDVNKFKRVVSNMLVLARAEPHDKLLLVTGLMEIGNIVAVTGDGTNDAPALKASDVGFAMNVGTEIAKNASDIILTENTFSSTVTALKYGRNVFDCIRKFLQFQLTTNIVAVFMTLVGGLILKDSPLNAIQMLWVNLIMDSFASLALATEPPKDDLLKRKPYTKDTNIVSPLMMTNIIGQALFQIIVLIIVLMYGDKLFNVPSDRELSHFVWNSTNGYHFTIFFNIFVMLQVFNSINARKLKKTEINVFEDITNNKLYIIIQLLIVLGQVIMVTFGGRALRTHSLSLMQHLSCILIAGLTLPIGILIKLLPFSRDEDVGGFQLYRTMSSKTRNNLFLGTKVLANANINIGNLGLGLKK